MTAADFNRADVLPDSVCLPTNTIKAVKKSQKITSVQAWFKVGTGPREGSGKGA